MIMHYYFVFYVLCDCHVTQSIFIMVILLPAFNTSALGKIIAILCSCCWYRLYCMLLLLSCCFVSPCYSLFLLCLADVKFIVKFFYCLYYFCLQISYQSSLIHLCYITSWYYYSFSLVHHSLLACIILYQRKMVLNVKKKLRIGHKFL